MSSVTTLHYVRFDDEGASGQRYAFSPAPRLGYHHVIDTFTRLSLSAEFLLLRTRAAQAAPVFEDIQRQYPDARSFGDSSEDRLKEMIASLGLRWRQPLFVQLARAIADCDGRIPTTVDDLRELPGVGPYVAVAAATAALHAGNRAAIVDANIVRLLCRLTGQEYDGETRRKR